jgi:hypothetical protein
MGWSYLLHRKRTIAPIPCATRDLTLIEEIVVGAIHGETIMHSISGIAGGTLHQFVATILIIFLILTPYFAFRSLGQVVGDKILVRLFLERRHSD